MVLVLFNAMKLSGSVTGGLAVSSFDWSKEMLTMADVYPTESEGMSVIGGNSAYIYV